MRREDMDNLISSPAHSAGSFQDALQSPQGAWLAPMAGVSDVVFRTLCAEQGCVMAVTEMVSAKGCAYAKKLPPDGGQGKISPYERLLAVRPGEAVGAQIFGSEPEFMAEAARRIEALGRFLFLDINMGCPVHKVASHGEGAALMLDVPRARRIVEAVRAATALPVTVKMRLGWEENTAADFAEACADAGARALAVHGRTRAQGYGGQADWPGIAEVKRRVAIPVIGNGDVRGGADALAMLRETGCDAVMVGRAAQGNPYVFAEIAAALKGEPYAPPTANRRVADMLRHARMMAETYGEALATKEMRKHIGWALKGVPGASALRGLVNRQARFEDLIRVLEGMRGQPPST